jgi:hypothetical protein
MTIKERLEDLEENVQHLLDRQYAMEQRWEELAERQEIDEELFDDLCEKVSCLDYAMRNGIDIEECEEVEEELDELDEIPCDGCDEDDPKVCEYCGDATAVEKYLNTMYRGM